MSEDRNQKRKAPKQPPHPADALEAAKAGVPSSQLDPIEEFAGTEEPDPSADAQVTPPPSPMAEASEPARRVERFRVVRKITVPWRGTMLRLFDGSIVSEESHGPGSIQRMRDAGVALEPVE